MSIVVGAADGFAAAMLRRPDLFDQALLEFRPPESSRLTESHRDGERPRLPRLAENRFGSHRTRASDQIFGRFGGHSIRPFAIRPYAARLPGRAILAPSRWGRLRQTRPDHRIPRDLI